MYPIFNGILETIGIQIIVGLILVGFIQLLETFLDKYSVIYLRNVPFQIWFYPPKKWLDYPTYNNILTTLAQIAGIFIGLYFTGISVVVSTVYSKASRDVRNLILEDKVSKLYIRFVALLGAVSLWLMGLFAIQVKPGLLNLFFVLSLGIITIYSFVILGKRIFHFLDPLPLIKDLTHDLQWWIKLATPIGYMWQNPSFQAHYQKQTEGLLTTYKNLVVLVIQNEKLQSEALTNVGTNLLALLRGYESVKQRIPSNSFWFKRTQQHKDWLTTDYTQIEIALQTSTFVQAEAVPDTMWFERKTEEILHLIYECLIERNDL